MGGEKKKCKYIDRCDHYKNNTTFCCRMLNKKLKACAVETIIYYREKENKEDKNGRKERVGN